MNKTSSPEPKKPNKKADIKSMSPDAKKKHLKKRRKDMDEAYDRTPQGKVRNEKYRSSEKETKSRENRNARSVAKRAFLNKQKELLVEISLLKNPPTNSENKENIQIETKKYQERVKVLVEKLPPEQVKIINLI